MAVGLYVRYYPYCHFFALHKTYGTLCKNQEEQLSGYLSPIMLIFSCCISDIGIIRVIGFGIAVLLIALIIFIYLIYYLIVYHQFYISEVALSNK